MKRLAVLQVTRHCDLPYRQDRHSELAESKEKVFQRRDHPQMHARNGRENSAFYRIKDPL
jgi:hypothetical protein